MQLKENKGREEETVVLQINDWVFRIDLDKTADHSRLISSEHCTCGYCENYYRSVNETYPELKPFLNQFGVLVDGPSEMYPIEPTLYLSGYRIFGQIIQFGKGPIMVGSVPVTAEPVDEDHFMLECGEMFLPWLLPEDMDEVISPANEPEFLEKMYRKLIMRNAPTGPFLS